MDVSISSEFQQFIERQVASGAYASPTEVVVDALRLLQFHEREREALVVDLRAKVAVGLGQLDRGEAIDSTEVFDELRSRNAQFRDGARP